MNKISKITKRDIFDLFNNGINKDQFFDVVTYTYPYYGRLEEIKLLERLYDLENMESIDSRFTNAKGDIWQHTINNDDYPANWVFKDDRFQLLNGDDAIFLDFICEIFHPEVRDEDAYWRLFLNQINELLNHDNYELYPYKEISGREVFTWRIYSEKNLFFIPFSIRYEKQIRTKDIKMRLSKDFRYQILQLLKEYDEPRYFTDETNWNYWKQLSEIAMEEIEKFYIPKNYIDNEYVPATDFDFFIDNTSPFSVLDIIEAFAYLLEDNSLYREKVNSLFSHHKLCITLNNNGEIINTSDKLFRLNPDQPIKEPGLEELLIIAEEEYTKGNYSDAVEKLWDAFERLKTYYYPTLDKKKSAEKIINEVSFNNESIIKVFETEFKVLTDIGNSFCIRHHEKNKIAIKDQLHFKYFYKRCFALISIIIDKLE